MGNEKPAPGPVGALERVDAGNDNARIRTVLGEGVLIRAGRP
jgi:hypothetical protein